MKQTPLHLAAREGHIRAIEILIAEGKALLNILDFHGNTALHIAANSSSREATMSILLSHGADPSIKNLEGKTAADIISKF